MASILALGDSYTIGEGVLPNQNYVYQFSKLVEQKTTKIEEIKIIARTGWRTDNLLDAIRLEAINEKFDYVFLLIGVNNQYQNRNLEIFENELKLLLTNAKSYAKKKNYVFILSVPDYGFSNFGKQTKDKISAEIEKINQVIRRNALALETKFIDITPISQTEQKAYYCADELHPSALQYQKWAEEILKHLDK